MNESKLDKKVYAADLTVIGEGSVIPAGVSIGTNVAISGITTAADYPGGELPSGGFIMKEGDGQ